MAKNYDRPQKVRTTLEELEVLSGLKESVQWAIVKRVAQRYINNVRRVSFKLPEDTNLSIRHAGLLGEALGINKLIKIIDSSGRKLEEIEDKKEKHG